MHVHLPKPLHGWRAFVGEVGIIVLGVLIALGAEQAVESVHARFKADQARTLLQEEIADHYFTATEAVLSAPCVDRQLQALESNLSADNESFSPVPSYSGNLGEFTVRIPNRVWSDDVWRSVVANGAAADLPDDLRFHLGQHYTQVAFMRDDTRAVDLTAWRLRALARAVQPDAASRTGMVADIEEARGRFAEMAFVANEIIGLVQDMKLGPPNSEVAQGLAASATLNFCREHGLPLGKIEPRHQS